MKSALLSKQAGACCADCWVPSHIHGRSAGGYYLLVQDVTERQALIDRLRDLAFHDALTGLPNRRAFLSKLDTALRESRDSFAAVIFIDLDGFKGGQRHLRAPFPATMCLSKSRRAFATACVTAMSSRVLPAMSSPSC